MQNSLFDTQDNGEQIQLDGANLSYFPNFYSQEKADALFQHLQQQVPWRQEQIRIAGILRMQPRLSAWFGDEAAKYTYSGLHLSPLPWMPALLEIRQDMERKIASDTAKQNSQHFNSVLLNYYRDEHDSMGWHSDDETELGSQPMIASLSLGANRVFSLKHKYHKNLRYKIPLTNGSLLMMWGDTQSHWLHAIAKEAQPCAARINLTFRQILPLPIL